MPTDLEYLDAIARVQSLPEFKARCGGLMQRLFGDAKLSRDDAEVVIAMGKGITEKVHEVMAALLQRTGRRFDVAKDQRLLTLSLRAVEAIRELSWNMVLEELKEAAGGQEKA